ncbi:MAG TPA: hypothetical protein VGM43_07060 [Bryobacteraceae bacterium]
MRTSRILFAVASGIGLVALATTVGASNVAQPTVDLIRVPQNGIQPQVVEKDGIVHLLYFTGEPAKGDLNYATSRDFGKTFSRSIRVNSEPGTVMATGNIRGGQLAIGANGRVHVAWIGSSTAMPRAARNSAPVLYARLSDSKDRFDATQRVNQASWGADGASIAADSRNNVYVFWHAQPPDGKDESNRRVWMARSADSGKSFEGEKIAYGESTGVCGCCGSRALAAADGAVYMTFRAATQIVNRDMYLLSSTDRGATFHGADISHWNIGACVMSSAALLQSGKDVFSAWESEKQVYFGRVDQSTHNISGNTAAPGTGVNRKYPALAVNGNGQILFVWTENMAWGKGGSVVWQAYNRSLRPESAHGQMSGVPGWSLVAAFAHPDGNFTVIY